MESAGLRFYGTPKTVCHEATNALQYCTGRKEFMPPKRNDCYDLTIRKTHLRNKPKPPGNAPQLGTRPIKIPIDKVVSGGQTGVDRAALDVAIELGIPHGGWCPRGRLSEDGSIPNHYELVEMASDLYADRTRQNILDSDGTLVLYQDRLQGGTLLTCKFAEQTGKPCLKLRLARSTPSSARKLLASKAKVVRTWLDENQIRTLNIAGPRGSKDPEIYARASEFLRLVFSEPSKLPLD